MAPNEWSILADNSLVFRGVMVETLGNISV